MRRYIAICLIILVFPIIAISQPFGIVSLGQIIGTSSGNTVGTGNLSFNFDYSVNGFSENVLGFTQGFKVYSPDGATWTNISGDTINGFGQSVFDLFCSIQYYSADGIGSDTIGFSGAVLFGQGLTSGFSQEVISLNLELQNDDIGKTICIDSSFYPPSGKWLWSGVSGTNAPAWSGPYCFLIEGQNNPCSEFTGLFCDDFSSGSSSLWTTQIGSQPGNCTWEVTNGSYGTSQAGTNQLCIQSVLDNWSNYIYEVDVRGNAGLDKEITFRTQDGLNTYDLNLIGDPVNQVDFNKVINGVSSNLTSTSFFTQNGEWYHVKVECNNSTFIISVDDVEILQYTDNNSPFLSGGIGLVNWTGGAGICDISFDNVMVSTSSITSPNSVDIIDPGTGSDLLVSWSHPFLETVTHFQVHWGQNFSQLIPVTQLSYRIENLFENVEYDIGVRAYNENTVIYSDYSEAGNFKPTIPIVLVHGWRGGSPETWDKPESEDDFVGWLKNGGFLNVWVPSYNSCGPEGEIFFDANAGTVGEFISSKINELVQSTGISISELNIVAHSMGGLVSRRMIATPTEFNVDNINIRNLVMLGTPNGGTKYGNLACYPVGEEIGYRLFCAGPANCELSSSSMSDFNDMFSERNGATFSAVAGNSCCGLRRCNSWFCGIFEDYDHDGTVAVSSVFDISLDNKYIRNLEHTELPITPYICDDIVIPILEGNPPISDNYSNLMSSKYEIEGDNEQIVFAGFLETDSIDVSSTIIHIEPASMLNVWSYAYSSDITMYLNSPTGNVVDSILVEAFPEQFTYTNSDGLYSYSILSPDTGNWQISLQSHNMIDSVSPVLLVATIESEITMQFFTDVDTTIVNGDVYIYSKLLDGISPLLGTQVTVNIFHDSLTTPYSVSLLDDGLGADSIANDGVYSTVFSQTNEMGLYRLKCNATGNTILGTEFERIDISAVYIQQSCCLNIRGNVDGDSMDNIDIADLVYYVDYSFGNPQGPEPPCFEEADIDASSGLDIADIVSLVEYMFNSGPAPLNCP